MPKRSRSKAAASSGGYGERAFWEQRYAAESGKSFEWFAGFAELDPLLREYLPLYTATRAFEPDAARLVDLGCGNSG